MSIKVRNLQQVLRRLDKASEQIQRGIDAELTDGAKRIEERAAMLAPLDRGLLRSTIVANTSIFLKKEVSIKDNVYYAAYQEFGTKRYFKDQGFPQVAALFKNQPKRGDYFDFLESILDWVKRKGLADTYNITKRNIGSRAGTRNKRGGKQFDERLIGIAQAIADKIIRNGIPPANNGTGYFFRSYREILPSIIENCRRIIRNR